MLYYMILIFVLTALFIRMNAGYDSRYNKCRYFTIKNGTLSRLLLDIFSPISKTDRIKKDFNKISIVGVYYYIALAVVLLMILVLNLIPDIAIEPIEVGRHYGKIIIDTLNIKVSMELIYAIMFSTLCYVLVVYIKHTAIYRLIKLLSAVVLLTGISATIYLLYDIVIAFISL